MSSTELWSAFLLKLSQDLFVRMISGVRCLEVVNGERRQGQETTTTTATDDDEDDDGRHVEKTTTTTTEVTMDVEIPLSRGGGQRLTTSTTTDDDDEDRRDVGTKRQGR